METAFTGITAVAAALAVVMAGWTVIEAHRLRDAQTSPEVVVYMERNDRVRSVVDLVIRNIGSAPAYTITLDVTRGSIPFNIIKYEDVYVLRNGINFLAPDQKFRFSLDQYPNIPKDEVTVVACYFAKDDSRSRPCRRGTFTLRPLEFEGYGEWQDREREAYIATKKGMDSLRKGMDALYRGRVRLTVTPSTPREPERVPTAEELDEVWKSLVETDWEPSDGPVPTGEESAH